jgi:UDP-N-acetylglucosamine 2-epimerase (non-hydrolysing)
MVVLGTRPECIKLAPVIAALKSRHGEFETIVCASGQHRELLGQAARAFDLGIDLDLGVMQPEQTLADLTGRLVAALGSTLDRVKPHWVVVQGDTTTALCAALTAYYARSRIAHVEAGLRSGDRFNPFPEEVNRRLIATLADLHFAPTVRAARALSREGVPKSSIHVTGNTVVDALLDLKARLDAPDGASIVDQAVRSIAADTKLVLVTCHRRESLGDDLASICRAIARIATAYPSRHIVFPVHLNPNVRAGVLPLLGGRANVHLLEPVGYLELVYLMARSAVVLTDSGGIQEEAPTLGVPVLVLRRKTERPEAIEAGFAELVGADEESVVARVRSHLDSDGGSSTLRDRPNPFGDGRAALRIVDVLARAS